MQTAGRKRFGLDSTWMEDQLGENKVASENGVSGPVGHILPCGSNQICCPSTVMGRRSGET